MKVEERQEELEVYKNEQTQVNKAITKKDAEIEFIELTQTKSFLTPFGWSTGRAGDYAVTFEGYVCVMNRHTFSKFFEPIVEEKESEETKEDEKK